MADSWFAAAGLTQGILCAAATGESGGTEHENEGG